MKDLTFKTHVIPVSVTPNSLFVLTETTEELYTVGQPGLRQYLTLEPGDSSAETAFWHAAGIDPRQASARLKAARVGVRMLCGMRAGDLKETLRSAGVRVGRPETLEILVAGDYLDESLAARRERPVLLMKPLGQTVWVGPLLRPGVTACWTCLATSLRENRPVQRQLEAPSVWRAALASTVDLAYSLAATETALWIAAGGENPRIDGRLIAFDTITHRLESHAVRRRPDCPACGSAHARPVKPRLAARRKVWGQRSASLDDTYRRMSDLVSQITGVIRSVAVVTNPYQPVMEIAGAGYNLPLACLDRQTALVGRPEGGSGKGATVRAAKVSAMAEAVERYSGISRGDERRVRAAMNGLDAVAIAPEQLLGFSEEQYRGRDAWNRHCRPIERVPEPFDPCAVIDWTPVWSLTRHVARYVPTAFCYFNYPEPAPYCQADSNGCAAGNSLEEAILHGFYELAERDAAGLWWYSRERRPGVRLDGFEVGAMCDALRRRGRSLEVLDLTTDLGVPVYAAVTADERGGGIAVGLAAHLDPGVAAPGAVADAMWQEAVVLNPEARVHRATRAWLKRETLDRHPYLRPRGRSNRAGRAGKDIRADLLACVRAAEKVGVEVLALDQTRGETGLAVARVIAPGLRHLWPRFGPGRMPLVKGGMNPVAFPF